MLCFWRHLQGESSPVEPGKDGAVAEVNDTLSHEICILFNILIRLYVFMGQLQGGDYEKPQLSVDIDISVVLWH